MQADARAWRPQAFGRRKPRDLADALVEPAWDGVRVLAHLTGRDVRIVDVDGTDLATDHPGIADELAAAKRADTLVVDGYLTDQALRPSVGVMLSTTDNPGVGEHFTQLFLGRRAADYVGGRAPMVSPGAGRTMGRAEAAAEEEPVAIGFVAIDLLALDDEPLLEIPLLERKRLLESVLPEGDLVRRTPFVREPLGGFIVTWRSLGFGGLAYKSANSRYHPGGPNDDWCLIDMPRR